MIFDIGIGGYRFNFLPPPGLPPEYNRAGQ